jgi:hypothetical protein
MEVGGRDEGYPQPLKLEPEELGRGGAHVKEYDIGDVDDGDEGQKRRERAGYRVAEVMGEDVDQEGESEYDVDRGKDQIFITQMR